MNNKHTYTRKALWMYVPLWLFFAYLFIQILGFQFGAIQNIIISGMYFVEFGVHEMSHLLFAFMPSLFVAAAGSIGEITFTVLIIIAAMKARSYFAVIFGALWLMLALSSVGNYMADARTQLIPLIGPGDQPMHDWFYVFSQLGWLQYDTLIGGFVRGFGIMVGVVALGFGLWLIIGMLSQSKSVPVTLKI